MITSTALAYGHTASPYYNERNEEREVLISIRESLSNVQRVTCREGYEEDAAEDVSPYHWISEAAKILEKSSDTYAKRVAKELNAIEGDEFKVEVLD